MRGDQQEKNKIPTGQLLAVGIYDNRLGCGLTVRASLRQNTPTPWYKDNKQRYAH